MIKLPEFIGHNYHSPLLLNISSILREPLVSHRRIRVFAAKGLKCHYCPKTGMYLIVALDIHHSVHVDIYTANFQLMTIDHVIPKCLGGTDDLENLVPACEKCNTKKGSKVNWQRNVNNVLTPYSEEGIVNIING